jgi:hypothetical protein
VIVSRVKGSLAVREPGAYQLTVRFSDGRTRTWDVDLSGRQRVKVEASREQ